MIDLIEDTPIHKLSLTINDNNFYIKRDDLIPVCLGGNKVRKAILMFQEIEKLNSDYIVTYGGSSSNHCRVIANMAASKKLKCLIISPVEQKIYSNNKLISRMLDAEIVYCNLSEVSKTIDDTLEKLKFKGHRPFFIEGGGHNLFGTEAYVLAYEEIKRYESRSKVSFDYIFHTSGTGTTQAGLVCGNIISNDNKKIIGISNARKNPYGGRVVLESANSYLKSRGYPDIVIDKIDFIDDYVLEGYGTMNSEIVSLIKDILISDGIPLDPVYTGKSFWGMQKYIIENGINNKDILFVHTGGTPLFYDYLEG